MMEYRVKQVAELAGVSVRTLHYYDEIDLLSPARVASNGYRYYSSSELFRLQQILIYRELGFELEEIGAVLDDPDYNLSESLQQQKRALKDEIARLEGVVATIDRTIVRLSGGVEMKDKQIFEGLSRDQLDSYRLEATGRWGDEQVSDSYRLWESYTEQQQQAIIDEGNAIYNDLVECVALGAEHPDTQALIARWNQHLRYFYEPSIERMRGLGEMYAHSPEYLEKFRQLHPALPEFLRSAISMYCDRLQET